MEQPKGNSEVVLVNVELLLVVPMAGKLLVPSAKALARQIETRLTTSPTELYTMMVKGEHTINRLTTTVMTANDAKVALSRAFYNLNAAPEEEEDEELDEG